MMDTKGCYQTSKPTIWHRLGYRYPWDEGLFDWRQEVPEGGDLVTTVTNVRLGWVDRLRLLISGRCEVQIWTKTSGLVGNTETRSQFAVLAPSRH